MTKSKALLSLLHLLPECPTHTKYIETEMKGNFSVYVILLIKSITIKQLSRENVYFESFRLYIRQEVHRS